MDQQTATTLATDQTIATAVQAGAAIVQALAAVIVLWLTARLVEATKAYVQTTRDQVLAAQAQLVELREARRASEDQLNELRAARAASFRPVIHMDRFGSSTGGMTADTLTLRMDNLGEGPAIDLAFEDQGVAFTGEPAKITLPPHANQLFTLATTSRDQSLGMLRSISR